MGEQRTAKLYMNREDALEYTGVTAKQLRQWREEGLIEPELGSRPGRELKFTERDLDLLKVIKKLRDERYPASTIKKMLSATDEPWAIDFSENYWNYERQRWTTRWWVAHDALATVPVELALPALVEMALVSFLWRSAQAGTSRSVRQTKVREIFDRVLEADRDPDESDSCIHSTLEHTPRINECVQYILTLRSEQEVRGDPDGPRVLAELADKVVEMTGLPLHEQTRVYQVDWCPKCGKYLVEEAAKNPEGSFCSEECRAALEQTE